MRTTNPSRMPIYRLLNNHPFPPEAADVIAAAYADVLIRLSWSDRTRPVTETVAKRIVELVLTGEREPRRIRQEVMLSLHRDSSEEP